jgi:DNA helicase-2/ATP-dependent DNA helicase PcrA
MIDNIELYGYRLRPHQVNVLRYDSGRMAVSAVPGSGKTLTLALLASRLILEGRLGDEGEVLVVTVQNSAVDNIAQRIRTVLTSQKVPPVGFHVCTLHKLASDILRQRNDLAGVEETFFIVDEAETARMMHNAAEVWIAEHQALWRSYLPDMAEGRRGQMENLWRAETEKIGREVTKLCKHLRLTPERARERVATDAPDDDFLRMGVELYGLYTRYLQARSGLDFDDLIWRATEALEQDPTFLTNLRSHWPYILEDEAQDSSPLQEWILDRLAGPDGNWVRVGDPNQSINSTFTAADPRFFRRFVQRDDVQALSLLQSGRSGRPIIDLANHLVHWADTDHPEEAIRGVAFELQDIMLTDPGDPQANPPDEECRIYFHDQAFPNPDAEAEMVARWAAGYSRRYPEHTVAVLVPAGWQGSKVVEALEKMPAVEFDDLLRSTPRLRNVARVLAAASDYLSRPIASRSLAHLYGVLAEGGHLGNVPKKSLRHRRTLVRSLPPHELLFPLGLGELEERLPENVRLDEEDVESLERFAELTSRWVRALSLPVDQLLLTIAQDLFTDEADLAVCHSIAISLRAAEAMHPMWRLGDFSQELRDIASNRRGLNGFSLADAGYTAQPGRVVITTMHKAKGLEWDAVFLMSVDSLEYPDLSTDAFRDELYFMPGRAPAVEARKRLEQIAGGELVVASERPPVEAARLEYIAERLRLLYVGITRARRNLAFTWSDTNGRRRVRPATALVELRNAYTARQTMQGEVTRDTRTARARPPV